MKQLWEYLLLYNLNQYYDFLYYSDVNTWYYMEMVKHMRKMNREFFAISFWFRQFFANDFVLVFLIKALTKRLWT